MALKEQWPKIEAWLKDNSATVADLSLRQAEKIIAPQPTPNPTPQPTVPASTHTSDGYDKLAEELIGSLEKMKAEEAEAAAQNTIRDLVHTVSVKKGVDWVPQFSKARKTAQSSRTNEGEGRAPALCPSSLRLAPQTGTTVHFLERFS
jgi:hypothetical protein